MGKLGEGITGSQPFALMQKQLHATLDEMFGSGFWCRGYNARFMLKFGPIVESDEWDIPHSAWHMDTLPYRSELWPEVLAAWVRHACRYADKEEIKKPLQHKDLMKELGRED